MKELFATIPDQSAPPPPPGFLDTVLVRGRRSVRRRRIVTAAAWATALLVLAGLVVPGIGAPTRPGAADARPSIPDSFAGYSVLTADVSDSPPGRAIALYGYGNGELFNMFQSLVVGAGRDTYRVVDAMEERGRPSALLSPDGTRILLGDDRGATAHLIMVDLTDGRRRSIPIGERVGVRLLAWSPDGRYVAYSGARIDARGDLSNGNTVDYLVARSAVLRLLDLTTGRSTDVPAMKPAWSAAFAPDSTRLAVQVGQEAHVIDLDGRELSTVHITSGRELVGNVGWSPDGSFLATVPWIGDGPEGGWTGHDTFFGADRTIDFVALPVADGDSVPPVPSPVTGYTLLGWTSPTSALVWTAPDYGPGAIAEVRLGDGSRRVIARFSTGQSCEWGSQPCQTYGLQLATGLLTDLAVRDAGMARRGPWPAWLTITVAAAVLLVALAVYRRRRRRHPSPPPPVG